MHRVVYFEIVNSTIYEKASSVYLLFLEFSRQKVETKEKKNSLVTHAYSEYFGILYRLPTILNTEYRSVSGSKVKAATDLVKAKCPPLYLFIVY